MTTDNMNPHDHVDFSKLTCWFFSSHGKEFAVERILRELNIQTLDVAVPMTFAKRMKMKLIGAKEFLPKENLPDVVITVERNAAEQVTYIKQQSPNTYVISIMFGGQHPYADLKLRRDEILSPASTGFIRGKLLRHLNALS